MWKHVLPPVVLVIVIWMAVSLTTSVYISYSDRVHQRILKENVTSIEAASDLQVICWRLMASELSESESAVELEARLSPRINEMLATLQSLSASASTSHESRLLRELNLNLEAIAAIRRRVSAARNSTSAGEINIHDTQAIESSALRIVETAKELRNFNGQLIDEEESNQKLLFARMMFLRNLTLLLGPIVGVVVGWRITSRLQSRVSTLAITLRSVASNTVYTVGEYSLRGANDLREIQHLSETVVTQMQQIGRDLERAELEIIQSERLAAVGELAAGVAHELRNPLTSVKLLLQHAAIERDCGQVTVTNMELILTEIGRMEETIQSLLDFSRPAALSCRIHDAKGPLQRAITLVSGRAIASRVSIILQADQDPLFVNGDIEQLHLVFVNLLINGVESMPSGGTIVVEAFRSVARKAISIVVRDSGCGIPSEILKKLFEPFVTTKERGTGLGLALCHRIVANHHGTIGASNQPQGGSVFRIELPAAVHSDSLTVV